VKNLIKLITSFFYLGYAPLMPGTVASAAAVGLYLLCRNNFYLHTILLVITTIVGFLLCGKAERIFKEKDSPKIVIDEVAGVLLSFWALPGVDPILILAGFFTFRALDAFKVYPANLLEKLSGSVGIMSDDLLAGLYTNIMLQIVIRGLM